MAEAHRLAPCQGEGVKIGVMDSGVDGNHPDLKGQVLPGIDVLTGATGGKAGWAVGTDRHGTAVAGTIIATNKGYNGTGVKGMAPKAQVIPAFTGTDKEGTVAANAEQWISGMRWLADQGVKIINISQMVPNSIDLDLAVRDLKARGVIFINAAGNKSQMNLPGSEGRWASLLVGISNQAGERDPLSVDGWGYSVIDVLAPGRDIVTTSYGGEYYQGSGSSYSSPITVGLAALIWCQFPNLTADEVLWRITSTATDVGPPGLDDHTGTGIINPVAALQPQVKPSSAALPSVATPTSPAGSAAQARAEEPRRSDRTSGFVAVGVGVLCVLGFALFAGVLILITQRRRGRVSTVTAPGFSSPGQPWQAPPSAEPETGTPPVPRPPSPPHQGDAAHRPDED